MSYQVLGSQFDDGFFVITDDENMHRAYVAYQMADPEDTLMPLEDGPAAHILSGIDHKLMVESFVATIGFYWYQAL